MRRRFTLWFSLFAAAWLVTLAIYLKTQDCKFWCDRQWAGVALYHGGYRSWSLTFCDGFVVDDAGKYHPITIHKKDGKGTLRRGYHWPQFTHRDFRGLLTISEGTNLWSNNFSIRP